MSRTRFALSALGLATLALVLPLACSRKAPGPLECEALAARALDIRDERALRSPRVKAAFDELILRCLTTPYDRQLLRCVDELGPARYCFADFERRQRLPDPQLPPAERY